MVTLWFKAKPYGYGWYPASIEGWLITAAYVAAVFLPSFMLWMIDFQELTGIAFTVVFAPYVLAITLLLAWICTKKGEKLGWRWGKRPTSTSTARTGVRPPIIP
jgi:hypothetical protein